MTVSRLVPLVLPHTMPGGARMDLQFSASATVGVTLDYVRHKTGGNFDFITKLVDPAVTAESLDGRLWEVGYTLRPFEGTEGSGIVSPRDAASFDAYDVSLSQGTTPPAEALLFVWKGVAIPGARGGDRIAVSLMVRLDTDEKVARFWTWVTREHGQSCSIDYIDGPILWIKGPALPNGGETHLVGQKRTRVLLGLASLPSDLPAPAINSPLHDWASSAVSLSATHPNPNQMLQCFALCSLNSVATPDPAYRRVFYAGTEDTGQLWLKDYRYQGYRYRGGGADDGYMKWTVRHYPPFETMVGSEQGTDWRGSWAQSYPVVVGAMQADADSFWYDVAEYYRDRMATLGLFPPRTELNPRLTASWNQKPSLFFPVIDIGAYLPRTRTALDYFETCLETLRAIRLALRSPHVDDDYAVLHFQTWLNNGFQAGTVGNPPKPNPSIYRVADGLTTLMEHAAAEGIRVSAYTLPHNVGVTSGWMPFLPDGAFRQDRSGALVSLLAGTYELEVGSPDMLPYWRHVTGWVRALGFGGIYLDAYSGGGFRRWFGAHGKPLPRGGGNRGSGIKTTFVDTVRQIMQGPAADPEVLLFSEVHEEGLLGLWDWIGSLKGYQPTHMLLAEETLSGAVSDLSIEARDMQPPLVEMVLHEYQPTQHLGIPFVNCLLATNTDWQPFGGMPGLSAAELRDLFCWVHAGFLANGSRPVSPVYQSEFDGWDGAVTSDPSGVSQALVLRGSAQSPNSLRVDPVKDPSGIGMVIASFLRVLLETEVRAYGGQFTMFGRMLRPIAVDYTSVNVARATNPYRVFDPALGKVRVDPLTPFRPFLLPTGYAFTEFIPEQAARLKADFEVPAVLSTMWQSPEGLVGLVLVNWTDAAASWVGTFDPSLYGITPPYDVSRLVLGGAPIALAAAVGAGGTTIGTTGSGATIDLGTLPARSTAVITFTT